MAMLTFSELSSAVNEVPKFAVALLLTLVHVPASAVARDEVGPADRHFVGGQAANEQEYPWQTAIEIGGGKNGRLCGGALVASQWALTAASCVDRVDPGAIRVKVGVSDYVSEGTWLAVQSVVVHPEYRREVFRHDVALLQLASPLPVKNVLALSGSPEIPVGQPLEVSGWGGGFEPRTRGAELLRAVVPYVTSAVCNIRANYNGNVYPDMLCAGDPERGIDSCQGDVGGPLVWRKPDGPELVGVVAWSYGCARKLRYGMYARVANYRAWVTAVMAQHGGAAP